MVDIHREEPTLQKFIGLQNQVNEGHHQAIEQLSSDVDLLFRMVRGQDKTVRVAGRTSTLHGDEGPLQWVFTPPQPYSDVEIACVPDGAVEIGMRCYAEKKFPGGRRVRFQIEMKDREEFD